jgi:methanogenic corrinoid protein MtbC1
MDREEYSASAGIEGTGREAAVKSFENAPVDRSLMPIGVAVAQLQAEFPEVSHSSLRFLEREGLLKATRTPGGHRLYSQADLDRVTLIKTWQQQGSSLEEIARRLSFRETLIDPRILSERFLSLIEAREIEAAQRLILDADRGGIEPETIFLEVLTPALHAVGDQWAAGALHVHEEKAISEMCREVVAELTLRHSPDFPTGPLLIAACVQGERHEIGLRMVYGLLRQQGYRVRYLGQDVATEFLIEAVQTNSPVALLLTATMEESLAGCAALMDELHQMQKGGASVSVLIGGWLAEQHSEQLSALGMHPTHELQMARRLPEILERRVGWR